jgi:uncharacterized protein (DUF58 family)
MLFWLGTGFVPLCGAAGLFPEHSTWLLLPCLLFLLWLAIDGWRSRERLGALSFEFPEVARAVLDRSLHWSLVGRNKAALGPVHLALELPAGLTADPLVRQVQLDQADARWSINWNLHAAARGEHEIPAIHAECSSADGWWVFHRSFPLGAPVRVYPGVDADRRDLAGFLVRRGLVGAHRHRQIGQGREFEKLREYLPGDAMEDIHWKATARRSHLVTKVFQIERRQEVLLILDASRLALREVEWERGGKNHRATILDRSLSVALMVGAAVERMQDSFGVALHDDRVRAFLRPNGGRNHYQSCRDALARAEGRAVAPDFDELMVFLQGRLRRRTMLIFLNSLDDASEAREFSRGVARLAGRHLVMAGYFLAPGIEPLFRRKAGHVDDVYAALSGHLFWQDLSEVERELRRHGVHCLALDPRRAALQVVEKYLEVRQRQLL